MVCAMNKNDYMSNAEKYKLCTYFTSFIFQFDFIKMNIILFKGNF